MTHPLDPAVSDLLREVAEAVVMPRFRALEAHQISEKTPGEIVTVADRESEDRLIEGLARLLPDAHIVGEEAADADPSLFDDLGTGLDWLIDPIDGTTNFSEGITPFALMVALVADGATEASWIYDPARRRMCHAHRGNGAFVDGERIAGKATGETPPVAALAMHFLSPGRRAELERRAEGRLRIVPIPRCAGEQYPRLAIGENDVSLFERVLPWDHAPGVLFLDEAGGRTARRDGRPYRVTDRSPEMLSAATPRLWDEAAEILFD